jgi:hypothetical protein
MGVKGVNTSSFERTATMPWLIDRVSPDRRASS